MFVMYTFRYQQSFCGYRDGKPLYKDITRKRINCYVKVDQTDDGEEYEVYVGRYNSYRHRR